MIDPGDFTTSIDAIAIVGFVTVEALVLYFGYGALERLVAPIAMNLLIDQ